jgi:hypothetical protein
MNQKLASSLNLAPRNLQTSSTEPLSARVQQDLALPCPYPVRTLQRLPVFPKQQQASAHGILNPAIQKQKGKKIFFLVPQ